MATDAERLDASLKILALDKEGEEWNDRLKGEPIKQVPKEEEPLPSDINALWQIYRNDISYIAKFKDKEDKRHEVSRRKERIARIKPLIGK